MIGVFNLNTIFKNLRMRGESLNARFKNGEINSKQLLTGLSLLVGGPKKRR
jgi:hypothetical protein